MKKTVFVRALSFVTIIGALSAQGLAEPSAHHLGGTINDYTAALDAAGPWHITSVWSLKLNGHSGKGDFIAALNMVRADNPVRAAHTHHVTLMDADVVPLANGFRLIGAAVLTSNGNLAGFSGSTVDIQATGGSAVQFSNVAVTFGGASAAHFGDQPLHGVVTDHR
jgi:hypothetical protein